MGRRLSNEGVMLITRTRNFGRGATTAFAGVATSAALILSLGVGVASSGASRTKSASPSAFCTTLLSFSKIKEPSTSNLSTYRKWIKTYLPTWEKLASEAPAGTKKVLSEVVVILKFEKNTANVMKEGSFIAKNAKVWAAGWRAFATDAISCVTSAYG